MESLSKLIKSHRLELTTAARALQLTDTFDLNLTVAVVMDGRVITTPLSGIPNYLPTSAAASSELFERFVLLRAERGYDYAWEALANGEDGEEWCSIWDEVVADRQGGAVLTADQLTDLVVKARAGFHHTPRELLVVHKEEDGGITSALVETPWFD
jgi:hypothetical protein